MIRPADGRRPPGTRRGRLYAVVACLVIGTALSIANPFDAATTGPPSIPSPLAATSLLVDIHIDAEAGEWFAIGERGHFVVSTNGASWEQRPIPTRRMLTGVTRSASGTLWICGHDGFIAGSSDGGHEWTVRHHDIDNGPLFDIHFADERTGLAVGAFGQLLSTTDGGQSWTRDILDDEEPHLYAITQHADGRITVVGEFGRVVGARSITGPWEALESPYPEGSFFGAITTQSDELLIFGLRGNAFLGRDDDWIELRTNTHSSLFGGCVTPSGEVILVGQKGVVVTFGDSRAPTIGTTVEVPSRRTWGAAVAGPTGGVVLVGEGGTHEWRRVP